MKAASFARGVAVGLVFAGAGLAHGVALAQGGERRPDLEELRERIEETRERVGEIERDERALLERLEEIDRREAELRGDERDSRRAADEALRALADAEAQARKAAAALARTQVAMERRVVALYKAGEVGPLRLLFSANELRDWLSRASLLRNLVEADARLVLRYRSARDENEGRKAKLAAAAAAREETAQRLELAVRTLARERAQRGVLLARVRSDRGEARGVLLELERAARALEETLERLGESGGEQDLEIGSNGFAGRKGSLPRPLEAPITQGFGKVIDAEFQTETFRNGAEFAAAIGDSVRAVARGRVRFAGWFRGYGRIVILDHGDQYFTVSGHLDEIFVQVGDVVEALDTLGSAGETGSLRGPSLYFEIRQGGRSLDPAQWVAGRGKG